MFGKVKTKVLRVHTCTTSITMQTQQETKKQKLSLKKSLNLILLSKTNSNLLNHLIIVMSTCLANLSQTHPIYTINPHLPKTKPKNQTQLFLFHLCPYLNLPWLLQSLTTSIQTTLQISQQTKV